MIDRMRPGVGTLGRQRADGTIRAILFDADGVIQTTPDFAERLGVLFGTRLDNMDDLIAELKAAQGDALVGRCTLMQAFDASFKKRGLRCDPIQFLRAWGNVSPNREVISTIKALRQGGLLCAIASNQGVEKAMYMSNHIGYRNIFDHQYYSCHLRAAKPDARFFDSITTDLGLPPNQVAFIDDTVENVSVASEFGMHAIHFSISSSCLACGQRLLELLRDCGVVLS
ncbi:MULTISPECIES: HAD-IA family hydrolase [unclassified Bradyrhizobium]